MMNRENSLLRSTCGICSTLLLLFCLSGCSFFGGGTAEPKAGEDGAIEKADSQGEAQAKKLLTEGMQDYHVGKYYAAVKAFEEIIDRYPFSRQAVLAELKAADCSYYMKEYREAESLYESFEENHPTNDAIPYVLYQKGMCNYRQIDRVDRDPAGAEKAVQHFKQLIKAFPDSPYSTDAQKKIALASEFLANHELFIANFYIRTEKFPQAKARLRYLLAAYPNSAAAPKSYQLLEQLKKGENPKASFFSSLPGFGLFNKETKENKEVTPEKQKEENIAPTE